MSIRHFLKLKKKKTNNVFFTDPKLLNGNMYNI